MLVVQLSHSKERERKVSLKIHSPNARFFEYIPSASEGEKIDMRIGISSEGRKNGRESHFIMPRYLKARQSKVITQR